MSSSCQFLLSLLSGSAVLCSLWVVPLPAFAQALAEESEPQAASTAAAADTAAQLSLPAAGAALVERVSTEGTPESTSTESLESSSAATSTDQGWVDSSIALESVPATPAPAAALAMEPADAEAVEPEVPATATPEAPAAAPPAAPLQQPRPSLTFPPPASLDFNAPDNTSRIPQDLLTDYVLGPGDQLLVLVLGYEEFEGARVVLPDGTITMPLIGSVPAAGRTLDDLSNDVQNRLEVYLTDPVVDTNLTVLRPVVVNIAGEVYRPGPVQLSSLTQVNTTVNPNANITAATTTPTLSSALAAAGGIKRAADIRSIIVQRRLPGGEVREFSINLWDALMSGQDPGIVVLADGDSVFVPTAEAGEILDQRVIASSSFAPTNVRVRVVGEVERPGEVAVQPNSSISSAVAAAGGPTDDAQLNNVTLVRLNDAGQIEEQRVDLSSLIDNYQIQDGDVVLVAKKGYLTPLDNFARILQPILAPFNLINLIGDIFDD
jgi:polysaccharide biosynthesis/export protein